MLVTIIAFILIFGILVLVHEYGHYYFAKRAGVLVREFSIGMGPKIWWQQRHGTTYTIRLLPVGGYVRLAGMDEDADQLRPGMPVTLQLNDAQAVTLINTSDQPLRYPGIPVRIVDFDLVDGLWLEGYENDDETQVKRYTVDHDALLIERDGTQVRIAPRDVRFNSASLPHRMMINFAGAMNNFILALVLFIGLGFLMPKVPINTNQLGGVAKHSPAQVIGLKAGDQITAVGKQQVKNWDQLTTTIAQTKDAQTTITYRRHGQIKRQAVKLKAVKQNGQRQYQLGIYQAQSSKFADRMQYGWQMFARAGTLIFTALGQMIHGFSLNDLGGPVAIYATTSQATHFGFLGVVSFLAMLSINLGIMNLLPIPALDGGKLLLNIVEAIIRRPIPAKFEGIVNLIGVVFLLILMLLVTFNDIQRYLM